MSLFLSTGSITGLLLIVLIVVAPVRAIQIVPQPRVLVVERPGKFHSAMYDGLRVLTPLTDRIAARVDLHK